MSPARSPRSSCGSEKYALASTPPTQYPSALSQPESRMSKLFHPPSPEISSTTGPGRGAAAGGGAEDDEGGGARGGPGDGAARDVRSRAVGGQCAGAWISH